MKKLNEKAASKKVAAMMKEISKDRMAEVSGGGTVVSPTGCRTCGIMQVGLEA